jgi:hypothetical protein
MFLKDPFAIGAVVPITAEQIAKKKLDDEWEAAGKPSLEERIETRSRCIATSLKRAFGEK